MAKSILIDSGVIIAALSRREQHHNWAKSNLDVLTTVCVTCEAVLTECFFSLEEEPRGQEMLYSLLEQGALKVEFSLVENLSEILALMRRYRDVPMSFADACLVRMSELRKDSVIFTTDSDFNVYRRNGRQTIPVMAPW